MLAQMTSTTALLQQQAWAEYSTDGIDNIQDMLQVAI